MKKKIILLSCAVFQILAIAGTANADAPYCREYSQTFTIGNTTQKGYGTACLQPDGSWAIQKAASIQPPSQVIVEQPVTYVVRENHSYYTPRPYRETIIIGNRFNRHNDYGYGHGRHHRW